MPWLIESDFAAAGEREFGDGAPAGVLDFAAVHAFLFECCDFRFEVVAEEVKFLAGAVFGWVDGCFGAFGPR